MKRPALRRVLLVLAVVLPLLLGGAAVAVHVAFGGGDYSNVVSITQSREYQDPALLAKAWALPVAAIYKRDGVDWQHNVSFCGPTSTVNVLRSLGLSADQQTILAGTEFKTYFGLLAGGMTLDEVAKLVNEKGGGPASVWRDFDLAAFRGELLGTNETGRRYIINFHRGPLFGKGGGHFSPIAGYLADEDLVLVLDVNESYRPWLVSSARLFSAMDTADRSSGRKRGLVVVDRSPPEERVNPPVHLIHSPQEQPGNDSRPVRFFFWLSPAAHYARMRRRPEAYPMTMFTLALALHALAAVLGLGVVTGLALAASPISDAPASRPNWLLLRRLTMTGTWSLVLVLLTGGMIIGVSGTRYDMFWWFRVSFLLFLFLGFLFGRTQEMIRRAAAAPEAGAVASTRIQRTALLMCAVVAVIVVLMVAKPA